MHRVWLALLTILVAFLAASEYRRISLRAEIEDVATGAAAALMARPGYHGGTSYPGQNKPYAHYEKTCDPTCEDTPAGCAKPYMDPLTGRVRPVPCDEMCCRCGGCRAWIDEFSGTVKCMRGTDDNTLEPCDKMCCEADPIREDDPRYRQHSMA